MRRVRAVAIVALVVLAVSGSTRLVRAQSAYGVVEDLNRQAMEAYNQLEIEKAGSMLEEALRVAYEGGIAGPLLAQTNLNLGVVYVGGLNDRQGGLNYFVQAVCADSSVQPDPLTSTPEIQSAFEAARQQASSGACPAPGAPAAAPAPSVAPVVPMPAYEEVLIHQPPPEQLTQTPLPLYVEVNPAARPRKVVLFYKGLGMSAFKRVDMLRYQSGLAYQVSCNDVWEPKVSYYIEVLGDNDAVVGGAGTAAQPIEVPVVAQRAQAAPALPGAEPPISCGAGECPPGVKGCVKPGTGAIGDSCDKQSDCQSGLDCGDDVCVLVGAGSSEIPESFYEGDVAYEDERESERDRDPNEFKRAFVQAGFTAGMALVTSGMPADRPPPDDRIFVNRASLAPPPPDPTQDPGRYLTELEVADLNQQTQLPMPPLPNVPTTLVGYFPHPGEETRRFLNSWEPDADSYDSFGRYGGDCSADGIVTGPLSEEEVSGGTTSTVDSNGNPRTVYPSRYCVRVASAGFVPGLALRMAAGYFVTPKISVAAILRFQFSRGEGALGGILLGARGEYMFTETRPKGLMISGFGGATVGQIQVKPTGDGPSDDAPFVKSGLMGLHVGANVRYRIHKHFGFFAAPELDVQLPTFLLNVDLTLAGVEGAF